MAKNVRRPMLVARNVLLSRDRQILLGLRAETGLWECAGGKVDDETVAEAAKREQLEETGIVLKGNHILLAHIDCFSLKNPDRRFVDLFLFWSQWEGTAAVMEKDAHLKWQWFYVVDLPPLAQLMPTTGKFVENFLPHWLTIIVAVRNHSESGEGYVCLGPVS